MHAAKIVQLFLRIVPTADKINDCLLSVYVEWGVKALCEHEAEPVQDHESTEECNDSLNARGDWRCPDTPMILATSVCQNNPSASKIFKNI
jgi:hypothetical protein